MHDIIFRDTIWDTLESVGADVWQLVCKDGEARSPREHSDNLYDLALRAYVNRKKGMTLAGMDVGPEDLQRGGKLFASLAGVLREWNIEVLQLSALDMIVALNATTEPWPEWVRNFAPRYVQAMDSATTRRERRQPARRLPTKERQRLRHAH